MTLRALSLTRPWPHAILHLGKRIENRGRQDKREPNALTRYRGPLYLHAAQSWAHIGDDLLEQRLVDAATFAVLSDKHRHPTGIVGKCRVVGHIEPAVFRDFGIRDPAEMILGPSDLISEYRSSTKWTRLPNCADLSRRATPPEHALISTGGRNVHVFVNGPLEHRDGYHRLARSVDMRWWQGGYALVLADVVAFDEPVPCKGKLGIWRIPHDVEQQLRGAS